MFILHRAGQAPCLRGQLTSNVRRLVHNRPMTEAQPPLILAVAQPRMQWSGEENTSAILAFIAQAASLGAKACVFPELAVTGFHRQIASLAKPALVGAWTRSVQHCCSTHGIAASFGSPTFEDDGRIKNSQVFVNSQGHVSAVVEKNGLTPAEATFFAYGTERPTFQFCGLPSTAVICREIEDFDTVVPQIENANPSVIYWPGLMGPEEGTEHIDPPKHVQNALSLAVRLGAYIVQSNWPNALNYPEKSNNTGRSAVISPTGKLLFRLPQAQPGLAVFSLGDEQYAWHAQQDA